MEELEVPPNVYGVAMVLPSVLNRRKDGTCIFLFEHLRIWSLLIGNYGIQLLFVLELWKMVIAGDMEGEVPEESGMTCSNNVIVLQFVCLFVFEVVMFVEVRDSTLILRLLWNTESPGNPMPGTGWNKLENQRTSAKGMVLTDEDPLTGWAKKKLGKVVESEWTLDGCSRCYRFFLLLVVGLPKLCVAIIIAYAGGWYVLESADRETLILNTLAMTFIINIDEFLYHAFTAQSIIDNISNMQPVKVENGAKIKVFIWFMNSIIYPIFIFVACGCLVVNYKRSVCSSYVVPWEDLNYKLPWHKLLE